MSEQEIYITEPSLRERLENTASKLPAILADGALKALLFDCLAFGITQIIDPKEREFFLTKGWATFAAATTAYSLRNAARELDYDYLPWGTGFAAGLLKKYIFDSLRKDGRSTSSLEYLVSGGLNNLAYEISNDYSDHLHPYLTPSTIELTDAFVTQGFSLYNLCTTTVITGAILLSVYNVYLPISEHLKGYFADEKDLIPSLWTDNNVTNFPNDYHLDPVSVPQTNNVEIVPLTNTDSMEEFSVQATGEVTHQF